MNDRERALQSALHELLVKDSRDAAILDATLELVGGTTRVADVSTFEEAGVQTRQAGLLVRMRDGSDYQLTIVESRTGPH